MDSPNSTGPKQRNRRIAERDRKRAVKACDGCRRLKEKCDGGVPCRRCIRLRRKCEFVTPAVGRHVDLGVGTSAPQQDNSEQTQRLEYMQRLLSHYVGNISTDTDTLRDLVQSVEQDKSPVEKEEESHSQESNEPEPEKEGISVVPVGNNITHYSGEYSHWNFSMRIKQWIEQCVSDQTRNIGGDATSYKEFWRAEELQSPSEALTALTSLPPRYVTDFLVHTFFKHAETNYFYIDQRWLRARIDNAYNDAASFTRRDVGTICIIFIVLAIGTQYAYLDRPFGSANEDTSEVRPFSEDAIGMNFYRQVCKLIPDVITVASLESVQACLLIGLYTLPLDAAGISYVYLNLAVRLAIQNGMHRKYPGQGLDPMVRETRNRVWWTAYTTERRISIFHGRPLSIAPGDVEADLPVHRDDLGFSTTASHLTLIQVTLELHQTLAKMSAEISGLQNYKKQEFTNAVTRLLELNNTLKTWWDSIPDSVIRKGEVAPEALRRSQLHLKIEYCMVRMYAGRPFITLRTSSSRKTPGSTAWPMESMPKKPSTPKTRRKDPRSLLVEDCIDAALSIIDICKTLHSGIGLARASYTEFSACRVALLVIVTQCLLEKSPNLRQALRIGLGMLRNMSAGGESARSEASLIEAFDRAIARLDAAEDAAISSGAQAESDYARFKQWEVMWQTDPTVQQGIQGTQAHPGGVSNMHIPGGEAASAAGVQGTPQLVNEDGSGLGFERLEYAFGPSSSGVQVPGADWNFASFPQNMDEFSSMFSLVPSPEGLGSTSNSFGGWT